MNTPVSNGHKAKRWVDRNFPPERMSNDVRALLIMAFGAGLDAGLAEAQEIIAEQARVLLNIKQIVEEP